MYDKVTKPDKSRSAHKFPEKTRIDLPEGKLACAQPTLNFF